MKRLCAAFLALALSFQMVFAAGSGDSVLEDALKRLAVFQVLPYTEETFAGDEFLTRGEFCLWILGTTGLKSEDMLPTSPIRFADVPDSHPYIKYIVAAHQLGYVSGEPGGLFAPDENITYVQALKIMLERLGYGPLAAERGGFPNGYLYFGTQTRITKGIVFQNDDPITKRDAAVMLNQMLDALLVVQQTTGYAVGDTTLFEALSEMMDTTLLEGTVTANEVSSIDGSPLPEEGYVRIDGQLFYAGVTNAADYLGYKVSYSFQYDQAYDEYILLTIEPVKRCEEIVIPSEDIISSTQNSITYWDTDGRKRTITLSSSAIVIRNGVYSPAKDASMFALDFGQVILVAPTGGDFTLALVQEYRHFKVEKADSKYNRIYLRQDIYSNLFNGKNYIQLYDEEKDDTGDLYIVEDRQGNRIDISSIAEGAIIAVQYAEEDTEGVYNRVILTDQVSGTVEAFGDDTVTLDGVVFEISAPSMEKWAGMTLEIGDVKSFYLDYYGRIADEVIDPEQDRNFAYLTETYGYLLNVSDGLLSKGQVQLALNSMANRNGVSIQIFDLADKVTVDGSRYSSSGTATLLKTYLYTPLRFTVNQNGEISKIYLGQPYGEKKERKYSLKNASFGGEFYINQRTSVFFVPSSGSVEDMKNMLYTPILNGNTFTVTAYDISDKGVASAIVIETDPNPASSVTKINTAGAFSLYQSSIQYVDEEGETRLRLVLYTSGKSLTVDVMDDPSVLEQARSMKVGDVFQYATNIYGEIGRIGVVGNIYSDTLNDNLNGAIGVMRGTVTNDTSDYDASYKLKETITVSDGTSNRTLTTYSQADSLTASVALVEPGGKLTLSPGGFEDLWSTANAPTSRGVEVYVIYRTADNYARQIYEIE